MKKNFKILLLLILFIPCIINADMGAPMTKPYEMIVTNPEGIDYYDYNNSVKGHLNKDDTFTVEFEYDNYYSIKIKNTENSYHLNSLNGTILVTDELDPKKAINESSENTGVKVCSINTKNKALIYADDGVDIKKGPANIYKTIGHIKKGVELTYNYYLSEGNITHIYVDYNGTKGWIEILGTKVLIETNEKYITKNDYDIGCAIIPKNTIITPVYTADAWSRKILINNNNCLRMYNKIQDNDLAYLFSDGGNIVVANEEINVYEYYNNGGKLLATIPKDKTFITLGSDNEKGTEESNLYVKYDNQTGWIKVTWGAYTFKEANNENNDELNNDDNNTDLENKNNSTEVKNDNNENKTTKLNTVDYVTMYIIICVTIVITALITIILINRKKTK